MINILGQSELCTFMDRFGNFEDALILGVKIDLSAELHGDIDILMRAQDRGLNLNANDWSDWFLVTLRIKGAYEYQFKESVRYPYRMLSDGARLEFSRGGLVVDLDPGPDDWSADGMSCSDAYSQQYVKGQSLQYSVEALPARAL